MKLLKKSIILSLIAPMLFSLLSFTNAVAGDDLVMIRIYETDKNCAGKTRSKIIITENGKSKTVELIKHEPYTNPETDNTALETISSVFKPYLKEGYKIESTVQNSEGVCQSIVTYILTK